MVKNVKLLEQFERDQIRNRKPDFYANLKVVEALLQEARYLGTFPPKDPLEGIDVDIRVAKAFNVRTTAD
ncbi:MAG: hypothetical protein NPIRA04_31570 [Nitrospirales bacterium]|nr:MAG: hypothetical protein NPIRA04_31570 [Nitrospirales bacterium]